MSKAEVIKLNTHRPLAYRFVVRTIRILGTLLFRPTVTGRENIPKSWCSADCSSTSLKCGLRFQRVYVETKDLLYG